MVLITLAQMSQMIFYSGAVVIWRLVCFNRQHVCPQHLPTWPSPRGTPGPTTTTELSLSHPIPASLTGDPVAPACTPHRAGCCRAGLQPVSCLDVLSCLAPLPSLQGLALELDPPQESRVPRGPRPECLTPSLLIGLYYQLL